MSILPIVCAREKVDSVNRDFGTRQSLIGWKGMIAFFLLIRSYL